MITGNLKAECLQRKLEYTQKTKYKIERCSLKYKICDNKKGIGIDDAVPSIIFIFVVTIAIVFLRINESQASDKNVEEIKKQKELTEEK